MCINDYMYIPLLAYLFYYNLIGMHYRVNNDDKHDPFDHVDHFL